MLNRKFNGTVDGIEMLSEAGDHIAFHDDHCVINI